MSSNNRIIEITLLKNKKDMDVVCAPTNHFCNLGCKMCHLTNNRLNKKMIPIENHYTLIKGVNDGIEEFELLCRLLRKYRIPNKFLKFNPISELESSENEELWINEINKEILELRVRTYCPPGKEIGSSCGESTKHYYHEEIETEEQLRKFEEWKRKHQVFGREIEENIKSLSIVRKRNYDYIINMGSYRYSLIF